MSLDDSGFSREDAIVFLEDQLHVKNAETFIKNDRLGFLNTLCRSLHHHSPFQNLSLLADSLAERHRPTWPEIKYRMTSSIGGLCYTRSIFTYYLLKALGYTVKVVISRVSIPSHTRPPINDHVITVALDVCRKGDRYLLETGFGFPSFEAIDLDFEQESPTFQQSHLVFKYVRKGDQIVRMHQKGRNGQFDHYYDFKMELLEPGAMEHDFDIVYTDPSSVSFHNNIHLVGYKNNKAVAIKNFVLLLENDKNEFDVFELDSPSDIIKATRKHFPQIPDEIVETAFRNWQVSLKQTNT